MKNEEKFITVEVPSGSELRKKTKSLAEEDAREYSIKNPGKKIYVAAVIGFAESKTVSEYKEG